MILISSPTFSLQSFDEIFEKISEHFDGWEIVAEGRHFLPLIKERLVEIRSSYDFNFSIHAPLSDINIASLNPAIRKISNDQIIEAIKIASNLDIKTVTMHPGHLSPLGFHCPDKVGQINEESIHRLGKIAVDHGITLCLENMPNMTITLCRSAEQLLRIIADTDIKICFDVGHANTTNQIDEFLSCVNFFANVHIHDNDGIGDKHQVIGNGNIEFYHVMSALHGRYNGDYVVEMRSLEDAIKSKNSLEAILEDVAS